MLEFDARQVYRVSTSFRCTAPIIKDEVTSPFRIPPLLIIKPPLELVFEERPPPRFSRAFKGIIMLLSFNDVIKEEDEEDFLAGCINVFSISTSLFACCCFCTNSS